jgi:hypothetical protein
MHHPLKNTQLIVSDSWVSTIGIQGGNLPMDLIEKYCFQIPMTNFQYTPTHPHPHLTPKIKNWMVYYNN